MEGTSAVLNVMTLPPGATPVQARLVFDGLRGAIFQYANGGPAGALVASWARTAGTDPYGNPYPAGLSIGPSSGDVIINTSGVFIYSGTPAAGNLIFSLSNVTTDPFGNTVRPGFAAYTSPSYAQLHTNAAFDAPALELVTGLAMETGHASLYAYAPGSGGTQIIELWMQGPSGPDGNSTFISLNSGDDSGSTAASGDLGYDGTARISWDANNVTTYDSAGNPYDVARLTLVTANPLNQNIGSTSFATIGNLNPPVVAGVNYKIEAVVQYVCDIAAGTAIFNIGNPGLTNGWASALFIENNTGTTYVGMHTNTLGPFDSNTMQITQEMTVTIRGYGNFSASGTIALQAATSNAADTFNIDNAMLTIEPMYQT